MCIYIYIERERERERAMLLAVIREALRGLLDFLLELELRPLLELGLLELRPFPELGLLLLELRLLLRDDLRLLLSLMIYKLICVSIYIYILCI